MGRMRMERQYDLGRRSYEKGVRFDFYADAEWQRGFRDARDAGDITGRRRIVIGGPADNADKVRR